MAWYAIWRVNNSLREDFGYVGGFISKDESSSPLHFNTKEEMEDEMKGHCLNDSGLVDIVEL